MTTTADRPLTASAVLAAADAMGPAIAARAAETESARRVPPDLLDQLVRAGFLRMLLPAEYGGGALDLPAALLVYESLSRADASVGWTVALGASTWCDLAGLPRATLDAVYAGGADVLVAGVFSPSGTAVPVAGGYRVNGRWAFASGCAHATWLYGNCVEDVGGEPRLRTVLFSPDEVRIEDTWHVVGLAGTGSHHFAADDVVVPAERTCATFDAEPSIASPLLRIPPPALFALEIASVAIGIARGALDDVVALATRKVPLLAGAPLAANPLFQHQLATADTELRAARTLLHHTAAAAWERATAGTPYPPEERARIRAAATWAAARAKDVVGFAYHAGGGGAVYAASPLQRRLRDVHALSQHFLVKPDVLTTAGAVLAGQEPDLTVF